MPRHASVGQIKPFKYTTTRGETRYMARVDIGFTQDGKRKRKTVTAPTYRAAQQKITNLLKEIRETGAPIDRRIKFGQYAEDWLEQKQHELAPNTWSNYATDVRKHLIPSLNNIPLSSIRPSQLIQLLSEIDQGYSLRRHVRTRMNQIFKQAVGDRLIDRNPVDVVPVPKKESVSHAVVERDAFSRPEFLALLDAMKTLPIEKEARMTWRFLMGQRQAEIMGARIQDLKSINAMVPDEEGKKLIPVTIVEYESNWQLQEIPRRHGCGKRINGAYPCGFKRGAACPQAQWRAPRDYEIVQVEGQWCLTRLKSLTGRHTALDPYLLEVMDRYFKETKDWPNEFDLIFRHEDGTPISAKEDEADFKNLLLLAGIDPTMHKGHGTWHTVVTYMIRGGADKKAVEDSVGHSNEAMTLHYQHTDAVDRYIAMQKMSHYLGLPSREQENGATAHYESDS